MLNVKKIEKCKRKNAKKILNTKSYIMYIEGESMSKIRIGRKEKEIIDFLAKHPEGVWKQDLLYKFSRSIAYDAVISKRLERMAQKGLIEIRSEINPESGRSKQRVYLKQ